MKRIAQYIHNHKKLSISLLLIPLILAGAGNAWAADQNIVLNLGSAFQNTGASGSSVSRMLQLFGAITILSVAPSIFLMVTCFVRFTIIFGFIRTAMGTQQSPPNQVLAALALFLTFFAMKPVFQQSWDQGIVPMIDGKVTEIEGFKLAAKPLHTFMLRNTRPKDLELFAGMAKWKGKDLADAPYYIVIPAHIITEIKRGFTAGFLLFIPFLIIDMIVSSVLMSMGMMMLPPAIISLPFKIVYFVLLDGWYLIAGTLVRSVNL